MNNYSLIGVGLTFLGLAFSAIGTWKQDEEESKYQEAVIDSQKTIIKKGEAINELQNKLLEKTDSNEALIKQVADLTEEKYRNLRIPNINVIATNFIDQEMNSCFEVYFKNTGGESCDHLRLVIDEHPSPLVNKYLFRGYELLPRDVDASIKIPAFCETGIPQNIDPDKALLFREFIDGYNRNTKSILIKYHFEFEWDKNLYRSDEYCIVKSSANNTYGSILEKNSGSLKHL